MKAKDLFGITGIVEVYKNYEKDHRTHNLVVDGGKEWVASMMKAGDTIMTHMAVGTDATTEDGAQQVLIGEVARIDFATYGTVVVSGNTIVYTATFGAGVGTASLNEAGIFNAASLGTMLARTKFGGPITKGVDDVVTIVWTITIS